jgi:aminobenzoyl-glutamate utilization protein B
MLNRRGPIVLLVAAVFSVTAVAAVQRGPAPRDAAAPTPSDHLGLLKQQAATEIDGLATFTQQTTDMLFSFAELGFQEYETSKYIVNVLRQNGFTVQEGAYGFPTGWTAAFGSGKPVIAMSADLDGLPEASQKPGVAYHDPIVEGAPGHGEGHNSGPAVQLTAAIALKKIMEREHIPGTLRLWPGVGNEPNGGKAWFVRDGFFKDVDLNLHSHVGSNFGVSWGNFGGTGLVSVEYTFKGETAHTAVQPWRGRSALDAVELMDVGWNFRREHLRPEQRSHNVITNGGGQPNVVPGTASVWYFFRELDYPRIKELWAIGNRIAQAAAMMTDTTVTWRLIGEAWPEHMNKPLALDAYENMKRVGLPRWSEADQSLARAVQMAVGAPVRGLSTTPGRVGEEVPPAERRGGGSDDIGDVSWTVPTILMSYPSNIPGAPGHTWASSIAMATPIAHKGATAGAKVLAMTTLDALLEPKLVSDAWEYFRTVQTKDTKYTPLLSKDDAPATYVNQRNMAAYREQMKKYYYDPSRYPSYLAQLGIKYPTLEPPAAR